MGSRVEQFVDIYGVGTAQLRDCTECGDFTCDVMRVKIGAEWYRYGEGRPARGKGSTARPGHVNRKFTRRARSY
jgi:hypothetical protein